MEEMYNVWEMYFKVYNEYEWRKVRLISVYVKQVWTGTGNIYYN